jgi:hypothetical protein
MFIVSTRRQTRRVGVLLGGSGRACMLTIRPRVAALLRSCPCARERGGSDLKTHAAKA